MLDLVYFRSEDSNVQQCAVTGVPSARDSVIERCCRP
jgi:hypothetical protein